MPEKCIKILLTLTIPLNSTHIKFNPLNSTHIKLLVHKIKMKLNLINFRIMRNIIQDNLVKGFGKIGKLVKGDRVINKKI